MNMKRRQAVSSAASEMPADGARYWKAAGRPLSKLRLRKGRGALVSGTNYDWARRAVRAPALRTTVRGHSAAAIQGGKSR